MTQRRLQITLTFSLALATFSSTSANFATAQVVDISPTASNSQAYYANWGANTANAQSPAAHSYNNYRKGGAAAPHGLAVVADNSDGISATWSNVNQGGGGIPCCSAPGMFFGQTPSTSSYSDARLFLRSNVERGFSRINDSNGRNQFDLRIGFTESPSDWIAGKPANSGEYDLWVGDHGSDTIYFHTSIGATDDLSNGIVPTVTNGGNLIDPTNQFVILRQDLMAQSGNNTAIPHEGFRDRWFKNQLGIAQAPTVRDLGQPSLTLNMTNLVSARSFDTGIAYDGDVPIEWSMELDDPSNADPILARQVQFHVKVGNVEFTQVFDPGGANTATPTDDAIPNPTVDPGNAFTDGYFDWRNATPVFYLGSDGGAASASLTMGFTVPEPSTALLLIGGILTSLSSRRKRSLLRQQLPHA